MIDMRKTRNWWSYAGMQYAGFRHARIMNELYIFARMMMLSNVNIFKWPIAIGHTLFHNPLSWSISTKKDLLIN